MSDADLGRRLLRYAKARLSVAFWADDEATERALYLKFFGPEPDLAGSSMEELFDQLAVTEVDADAELLEGLNPEMIAAVAELVAARCDLLPAEYRLMEGSEAIQNLLDAGFTLHATVRSAL